MITVNLTYTYTKVTPESAEAGDHAYAPGDIRAHDALRSIEREIGAVDHAEINGDKLTISMADLTAHVRGNPRLLRALLRALVGGVYYVSATDGVTRWVIAGPYASRDTAQARIEAVIDAAREHDGRAAFLAWGVCAAPATARLRTALGVV